MFWFNVYFSSFVLQIKFEAFREENMLGTWDHKFQLSNKCRISKHNLINCYLICRVFNFQLVELHYFNATKDKNSHDHGIHFSIIQIYVYLKNDFYIGPKQNRCKKTFLYILTRCLHRLTKNRCQLTFYIVLKTDVESLLESMWKDFFCSSACTVPL